MHLAFALPVVQRAIDPVGWIIGAIVVFNLLSPLFARRKRKAVTTTDGSSAPVFPAPVAAPQASQLQRAVQSRQQASQSVQQSSQSVQQSVPIRMQAASTRLGTLSDAEREKLRQALTAAGVSTLGSELQRRVAAATPPPPARVLPAPELPPAATADGLTLMTLESGATAFNRLGARAAAPATAPTSIAFSFRKDPRAVANAFVAAAIVGPCAALRPLGHTPAGW